MKKRFTEDGMDASRRFGMIQAFNSPEEAAMLAVIGLDIAKRVFQLHSVDPNTGEIVRLKLTRSEMMPFFANRQPSIVAMEACGSSHHWARQLRAMGHEVRLIATKFVTPFVKSNKNDAADAQAIWEAAQRPEMRFVPVKSESQQAILALHSMREGLIKARTAQLHQLRAVFYELGVDLPEGRHWCVKQLPAAFERLEGKIPDRGTPRSVRLDSTAHYASRRHRAKTRRLQAIR